MNKIAENKNTEYVCDACNKKSKDFYELDNGEYVCQDCYTSMTDLAEYYYDLAMENEATGN
jgi:ribosomal protein L37AE/L43A